MKIRTTGNDKTVFLGQVFKPVGVTLGTGWVVYLDTVQAHARQPIQMAVCGIDVGVGQNRHSSSLVNHSYRHVRSEVLFGDVGRFIVAKILLKCLLVGPHGRNPVQSPGNVRAADGGAIGTRDDIFNRDFDTQSVQLLNHQVPSLVPVCLKLSNSPVKAVIIGVDTVSENMHVATTTGNGQLQSGDQLRVTVDEEFFGGAIAVEAVMISHREGPKIQLTNNFQQFPRGPSTVGENGMQVQIDVFSHL